MHDARIPEHDLSHGVLLSLQRIGHARSCCLNFPPEPAGAGGVQRKQTGGRSVPRIFVSVETVHAAMGSIDAAHGFFHGKGYR